LLPREFVEADTTQQVRKEIRPTHRQKVCEGLGRDALLDIPSSEKLGAGEYTARGFGKVSQPRSVPTHHPLLALSDTAGRAGQTLV